MDKKQLYESIMTSVSKEVKKALNEYRVAKPKVEKNFEIIENDVEKWLKKSLPAYLENKLAEAINATFGSAYSYSASLMFSMHQSRDYRGDDIENEYTCSIFIGNRSYYETRRDMQNTKLFEQLENAYRYLKTHEEFKITSAPLRSELEVKFKYYLNKDEELYNAIEAAKNQFEQDVQAETADEFAPTRRDWEKMIGYMNNHSNPERVAKSCKDHNKIVARYIIAKTLGWSEAAREFLYKIKNEKILSEVQLEAYRRKYATYNIPDDIKEFIDDIAEFDETGGIATHNIEHSEILPENVKKYIYNNKDIRTYKIELLQPIPLKKTGRGRFSSSYNIGTANLAKVTFKMVDGSEKDTWFVYGSGYAHFSKYQPNQAWKDEIGSGTHAVHNLEYIFS